MPEIDYTESLFRSIDTIVAERIKSLPYDQTELVEIIDDSNAKVGIYKVSANSQFEEIVYSDNSTYKNGDKVYLLRVTNTERRFIIGLYSQNENDRINRNDVRFGANPTIDNILSFEYPIRYANLPQGMTYKKNQDHSLTLTGTNDNANNAAFFYFTNGTIAANTAYSPPAGLYQLKLIGNKPFGKIFARLYYGTAQQYIDTDLTGESMMIYLDGHMQITVAIIVLKGITIPEGLKLTPVLTKIGTPDFNKIIANYVNQTEELQRKILSILHAVKMAESTKNTVDKMKTTLNDINDIINNILIGGINYAPKVASLNKIGKSTQVCFVRYGGIGTDAQGNSQYTAFSPYTQGLTTYRFGFVIDYRVYVEGSVRAIQIAFMAGISKIAIRSVYATPASDGYPIDDAWTPWKMLIFSDDLNSIQIYINNLEKRIANNEAQILTLENRITALETSISTLTGVINEGNKKFK